MSFWVIGPTGTRDASCRRHAILAVAAIPGAQMVDRREVGDQGDRP